jgi:phosphatidylglycerophosphatase A
MNLFVLALATWFGAGYFPIASGTFATAIALAVAWWLRSWPASYPWIALGLTIVGVWSAGAAEGILKEKDSHKIVIDEIAGYFISMAFLAPTAFNFLAAFFIFRVFDVWKPFPARQSQVWPGGWGVMADDLIVAVYTNLLLQGVHWLHWV